MRLVMGYVRLCGAGLVDTRATTMALHPVQMSLSGIVYSKESFY